MNNKLMEQFLGLNKKKKISDYGYEMVANIKKDKSFIPVVGREKELDRIYEILCRFRRNNSIILGKSGIGKTSLIKTLAYRISKKQVPYFLQNYKIFFLNYASIISDTGLKGSFEKKLEFIFNELPKLYGDKFIIFIDEMHNLFGNHNFSSSDTVDLANYLKPIIETSKIKIIGSTTVKEFNKFVKTDEAFVRRFELINLTDLDRKQIEIVILQFFHKLEKFYNFKLNLNLVNVIINLSSVYDGNFPDKAIETLDSLLSISCLNRNYLWTIFTNNSFEKKKNFFSVYLEKFFLVFLDLFFKKKIKTFDDILNLFNKELQNIDKTFNLLNNIQNIGKDFFINENFPDLTLNKILNDYFACLEIVRKNDEITNIRLEKKDIFREKDFFNLKVLVFELEKLLKLVDKHYIIKYHINNIDAINFFSKKTSINPLILYFFNSEIKDKTLDNFINFYNNNNYFYLSNIINKLQENDLKHSSKDKEKKNFLLSKKTLDISKVLSNFIDKNTNTLISKKENYKNNIKLILSNIFDSINLDIFDKKNTILKIAIISLNNYNSKIYNLLYSFFSKLLFRNIDSEFIVSDREINSNLINLLYKIHIFDFINILLYLNNSLDLNPRLSKILDKIDEKRRTCIIVIDGCTADLFSKWNIKKIFQNVNKFQNSFLIFNFIVKNTENIETDYETLEKNIGNNLKIKTNNFFSQKETIIINNM